MIVDILLERTNAHYEEFCKALWQAKRIDIVINMLTNNSK